MNGFTDLIRWQEPFILVLIIIVLALISFGFAALVFRDGMKRILFCVFLLFFLLFARVIFTAFKEGPFHQLRPIYFFGASVIILLLVYLLIRKSSEQNLQRFSRFLRLTFSVLIVYELFGILFIKPRDPFTLPAAITPGEWKGTSKPNIYVLLFDEYQGNKGLAKLAGYQNTNAIGFLRDRGFAMPEDPRSSYQSTIYAVPSLFLMDTLSFPTDEAVLTTRSAMLADRLLSEKNTFTQYLKKNGYTITCHSIFRVDGQEPGIDYPIGASWLELQQLKTLPGWAKNDLFNALPSNSLQKKIGTLYATLLDYNRDLLGRTEGSIGQGATPKFVFSHFLLPHPPAMLDSNGSELSMRDAMYELNLAKDSFRDAYLGTVVYTNRVMAGLIEKISKKDPGAVVIILSDHGCRALAGKTPEVFNIQWAMKIPGRDSIALDRETKMINTFRILLNNIAGQQLPMVEAGQKY